MRRFFHRFVCVTTALLTLASVAIAQPSNRCADCHYAQINPPNPDHLLDWQRSAHARNSIGCERCHGGNAAVFEPFLAHRDILDSSHRRSPVNRVNLPTTCGRCHVGPFVAFQKSIHYHLLESGSEDGPTCSTCHDSVAGRLLSAKALESRCNQCHGARQLAPRADRATHAREMYEALGAVRAQLKIAKQMIKKVADKQRRADLMDLYAGAEVPVTRAVNAGHAFVYDELQAHLVTAQQRVDRLMAAIGNRVE
jgi:cytochrome c7-like protein/cytochrome c554/c'-like protein